MKFKLLLVGSLVAIGAMALLAGNITEKEKERVELAKAPSQAGIEGKTKSEEWAKYYPRQFDSWKKTKESDEIVDVLEEKPFFAVALAGYSYSKEFNKARGHYYAVQDQINSLKIAGAETKIPSLCWTCHSGSTPELIAKEGEKQFYSGTWVEYGSRALNPIGCNNCHDDKTAQLSVKLPHLDRGLKAAGLKTFEESTHQEKRTLVCMQCHTEFYVKKEEWKDSQGNSKVANMINLPYNNGAKVEDIEKFYNDMNLTKYVNPISKTPMVKAVHTYWENWRTGTHAKQGVACADCHMPYTQEGSVKYSDHQIQSPLKTMDKSCMNCHRESEAKLQNTVKDKKDRFVFLRDMAFENFAKAHLEIGKALEAGASDDELKEVRGLVRNGQFRADMVLADHGAYFHSSEESLKYFSDANNMAQQARIKLVTILANHGVMNYVAPDFDTKDKAQKLAKIDLKPLIEAKIKFKETLEAEWKKEALAKGYIAPNSVALEAEQNKKPPYYKDVNR